MLSHSIQLIWKQHCRTAIGVILQFLHHIFAQVCVCVCVCVFHTLDLYFIDTNKTHIHMYAHYIMHICVQTPRARHCCFLSSYVCVYMLARKMLISSWYNCAVSAFRIMRAFFTKYECCMLSLNKTGFITGAYQALLTYFNTCVACTNQLCHESSYMKNACYNTYMYNVYIRVCIQLYTYMFVHIL